MQASMITQAVILAGGLGKGLGALSTLCPQPALPVGVKPFLGYIFEHLREQGLREIIVCTGHLASQLEEFTRPLAGDMDVRYVREAQPLGTGGALRHCLPWLHDTFFVCHGDSLFRTPLQPLAETLVPPFAATLAMRELPHMGGGYGGLQLQRGVIQAFEVQQVQESGLEEDSLQRGQLQRDNLQEGEIKGNGLIYGGISAMRRVSVQEFPVGDFSLKNDFFPFAAARGLLGGLRCAGLFVDIDSPAAYAASHALLASPPMITPCKPRKAVFLDRDGTLIVEKNYLHNPEDVEILPHVIAGLGLLQKAGYALIVVTNQSGVGRGYFSLENMHEVNARLKQCLIAEGINLDGLYYCPHSPDTQCLCRKPLPGMLAQAAAELTIDMSCIASVGDKDCDVLLGQYLGGKGIRVRTGYGMQADMDTCSADYVADTFLDAAKYIVHTV